MGYPLSDDTVELVSGLATSVTYEDWQAVNTRDAARKMRSIIFLMDVLSVFLFYYNPKKTGVT